MNCFVLNKTSFEYSHLAWCFDLKIKMDIGGKEGGGVGLSVSEVTFGMYKAVLLL